MIEIMAGTLERSRCVCGYHVYSSIWDATVGEELLCERELSNERDRYTVLHTIRRQHVLLNRKYFLVLIISRKIINVIKF